jgi:hypothetical protein
MLQKKVFMNINIHFLRDFDFLVDRIDAINIYLAHSRFWAQTSSSHFKIIVISNLGIINYIS